MSNYVQFPKTVVSDDASLVIQGYDAICCKLLQLGQDRKKTVYVVECYPGVNQQELLEGLRALNCDTVIHSDDFAFEPEKMDALLERDMTDDRVFGVMTTRVLQDYFYMDKVAAAKERIDRTETGSILVYGVGASLVHSGDVCIMADITRWEIQLRYRAGMDNWRTAKQNQPKLSKYKRGFFAEWRWADRVKDELLGTMDFYLDATTQGHPAMVSGDVYRKGLSEFAVQPFRLVPYFDPGVWGGDWMKEKFALPDNGSNYAWSFDGVPEENSLLMDFGGKLIQTPALNLVYWEPRRLLGDDVHARFGKEFPIRFDLLDTIHGQNLSLQVHPLTEYIQREFNMRYTQDESYYILDTAGEDPCVYLGVKTDVDREAMASDLRSAQRGEMQFPAENYVNRVPVKKHDHILIPAGTVHCSGANSMVLEISATPYIFTFKMWDWGRVDLDGKPRPIHVEHALKNIQWERDTQWIKKELVNHIQPVYDGEEGRIEKTGLHHREFIETNRFTTESSITVPQNGSVHVMNLVEGTQARIVSTTGAFAPYTVHYAETAIVPEAAGEYRIESPDGSKVMMIIASVRT